MTVQFNENYLPEKYASLAYNTKARFVSYWHQLDEIANIISNGKILELGLGNGILKWQLKNFDFSVVSLDLNPHLGPDVCGNIVTLPFASNAFQVAVAFQVLEHIPYQDSLFALKEMQRCVFDKIIISVPDHTRWFGFTVKVPKLGLIDKSVEFPLMQEKVLRGNEHYWEIGVGEWTWPRYRHDIEKIGLKVLKTYRPSGSYNHRFIVLE